MSSVPRFFSSHSPAHGALVEAIATDLGVAVNQDRDLEAIARLEVGITFDVDGADGHTKLGRKRRQGAGHVLAEVAIGTMIKDDVHGLKGSRKGPQAPAHPAAQGGDGDDRS